MTAEADCAAQASAVDEKGQGNRAFAARDFEQAIMHFSKCIELDPECVLSFAPQNT